MASISATFSRDGNRVPITEDGVLSSNSITLSASNTTAAVPVFSVTGAVEIRGIWGIVTTVLGSNHTAAYLQINDQTATPDITLASGTTMSSAAVGSIMFRTSTAGVAIVLANASAGRVNDPVAATAPNAMMPFIVTQKTGGVATNIEYVYSTTNTPTSGVIKWFVRWLPLSDDANITAI